jgi:two-component system sensor histidine kinase MprB
VCCLEHACATELADVWMQQFRHDLRQPLMTLSLLLDTVATTSALGVENRGRLMELQRQIEWMQDMLGMAESEPAVRVVDVGETIGAHCTPAAAACEVQFIQVDRVPVLVDPVELTRAARNLLDNATRAAGDRGTVEVTVARSRAEALLEVADSGPGFGRIRPQHGHGLVNVRRFAERYGGYLNIASSHLGGAAVTLHLPLAASATAG